MLNKNNKMPIQMPTFIINPKFWGILGHFGGILGLPDPRYGDKNFRKSFLTTPEVIRIPKIYHM